VIKPLKCALKTHATNCVGPDHYYDVRWYVIIDLKAFFIQHDSNSSDETFFYKSASFVFFSFAEKKEQQTRDT